VRLQFDHVLAGETGRRRETQGDAVVDRARRRHRRSARRCACAGQRAQADGLGDRRARGPDSRTMPTRHRTRAVAIATMVSVVASCMRE
jgi:hypothetical protein